MVQLAGLAGKVGLVSMAHTRQDLNRSRPLADAGIDLYLWHSPWLDGAPPESASRSTLRVLHHAILAWIARLRAGRDRPADTAIIDGAFSNMAPGLIKALSERPWHVLAVIQSTSAAMFDYVPRPPVTVLVMHDIRARLYERRATVAESLVERWRYRAEARRYRRFERQHCRNVDLVVTVSEEDARWVREQYQPPRVFALPLPVDTTHFLPSSEPIRETQIVFTGYMSHPPNVDAAVYFARTVLPRIRARNPALEFHVVGRNPVAEVRALASLPGVTVLPDVPDIRTHIAEAAVVVVPLRYGSGARQKILEAWSMGKCVVATPIGAEGLEVQPGENILIAEGADGLADAVLKTIAQPDLRDKLGCAGRSVAETDHNPARLAQGYFRELTDICAEKARQEVPMRVLLDMRWMVPGLAGGLENLARSFLQELAAIDGHNKYSVLLPVQSKYDFDLRSRPNFQVTSLDSAKSLVERQVRKVTDRLKARLHVYDWRTPEVRNLQWLAGLGAGIAYSFPGYIHPDVYPLRQVLIVPDIQHEYLPAFFSPGALEERRRVYTGSINRADHICTISEFTRQTLIDKLNVRPGKITTVLLAADPAFVPRGADAAADRPVLARYGLEDGGYWFFPAHTWHHKNHRVAIDAIRVLRDRYGVRMPLVCSGGPREAQPAIDQQVAALGLEEQVRFLGYVHRLDVPALYRGAASLIFPSLFEGFGMPVLEAMASGCPVICSNTTSLPEIAGDAALLVDPNDAEKVAAAANRLLTDRAVRDELVSRGLRQASGFSWRRHVFETLAVLRQVHCEMRTGCP
jgi:glycosyltransferase involved in cell wall biosynthesis